MLGGLTLLEVLKTDRDELERRLVDASGYGDDGAMRECLQLILEEAVEDLRTGTLDVGAASMRGRSRR